VNEKICEFYLQPRGCIKGDKCDFKHPLAPGGGVTNKVCEYYLKPRGCIKGDACDFLHPNVQANTRLAQQLQSQVKQSPCTFFNSPRGCVKGDKCDFLHPSAMNMMGMMGQMGMGGMMGGMGMPGAIGQGGQGGKVCEFFMTPRGCSKGNSCDFAHIPGGGQQYFGGMPGMIGMPMGGGMGMSGPVNKLNGKPLRPKACEFFSTERGCIKGDSCDFIHQKQKPCEFTSTPKGCRKGKFCDFLHPEGADDTSMMSKKMQHTRF